MLDFIMDVILDPLLDLPLCEFNIKRFSKHAVAKVLLGIGTIIFIGLLAWGFNCGNWFLILVGGGGSLAFAVWDWRYGMWWFREGRFGADPPWLDSDILPKGDITTVAAEEEILRRKTKDAPKDMNRRL